MRPDVALRLVRLLHTVVWLLFVACIVAIPVCGHVGWYRESAWLVGIVLVEVLVLACNNRQCPLTAVAARYTADRRDNFDIYLPVWVARYNKEIFGTLYVAGTLYVLVRWLGSPG